ncbi:MAG TPA: glycosyltransferase [Rhizomicrobium sp.]|nr:glycosyltransferase [Rhizomicrobium sp.]
MLLSLAAAAWWLTSIGVLLASFAAALLHPLRWRNRRFESTLPALSAIVPVKDIHPGFAEAQRSLLSQDYSRLEVLIATADANSPALPVVRRMHESVAPRIVVSDCNIAASPKLNNLWPAIWQAQNDVVVTKDSNIVLHPGDLAAFAKCLVPGVGLVSAIPIAKRPMTFSAWIEASIINGYHARVLILGNAAGLGFGLGKVMLFRRSDLARAGGLDCVKWAVGEDMALARAMRRLGLRTVLADRLCDQVLGERPFAEVWQRQLRWMTIWRIQLPPVFIVDLLGSALPTALAGAIAAQLIGVAPAAVIATTMIGWCAIESILSACKNWPLSPWSPLAFFARELLTPALWLRALLSNEVRWADTKYKVRTMAPRISQFPPKPGLATRQRMK